MGLSAAQVFVLRVLVREPGLSVSALAQRTLTHQSSVSVVVRKLVAARLVVRQAVVGDGRSVALVPTVVGKALAKQSADPIQERLLESLDRLPMAVRQRLASDLSHWIAALGMDVGEPEMFFETKVRG
jgi:DNA-binding MarR family transcriptional regulator